LDDTGERLPGEMGRTRAARQEEGRGRRRHIRVPRKPEISSTLTPKGVEHLLGVDANGAAEAGTDGLLIIRALFGFTGDTLSSGATAPDALPDPPAIDACLARVRTELDIDGNGSTDALTDGILICRHLAGRTGPS